MSLKAHLAKKRTLKTQLTKLKQKVTEADVQKSDLEVLTSKSKVLEVDLNAIFNTIFELADAENIDEYAKEKEEIDETLLEIEFEINRKLENIAKKNKIEKCSVNTSSENNVKLPKITLPTFSGNLHEWLSFKDIFKASVDQNPNLTAAVKLQYLKSALRGDAYRIIQSISIVDSNYELALSLLEERFSNQREQVYAHLKRFMNLQPMQNESASHILNLIDITNECVRSLETLEQSVKGFSSNIFAYVLAQKLDPNTKIWWERKLEKENLPALTDLLEFLKDHARTLNASKSVINSKKSAYKITAVVSNSNEKNFQNSCKLCGLNHKLYKCMKFQNLSVKERVDFVKKQNLCFCCFNSHSVRNCPSDYMCRACKKKHNSLLCFQSETFPSEDKETIRSHLSNESQSQTKTTSALNANAVAFQSSHSEAFTANTTVNNINRSVILSTARVFIATGEGKLVPARALCDSGSASCFCTTELADSLNLRETKTNISVNGISGTSVTVKRKAVALICNKEQTYKRKLEFLIIPKIAGITPAKYIDIQNIMMPEKVKLADSEFYKPGKLDLLLGVEVFYDMLRNGKIYIPHTGLVLKNSAFGYIVSGTVNDSVQDNSTYCGFVNESSESELKRFFELESIGIKDDPYCHEEDKALEIFNETVCFKDGRYEVNLPWKKDWNELADNYAVAESRLKGLLKRMNYDKSLFSTYREIFDDYLEQGIIEEVSNKDTKCKPIFYLPHQPVFREASASTKTRIVFDGSSHEVGQLSLNDCLWTGTNLNPNMFHLLIKFRLNRIAILADVEKAFLQISLAEKDRDAVRFLFVENTSLNDLKLQIYRFQRVNFGVKSSPFLLAATIKKHLEKYRDEHPDVFEILNTCIYVDDLITGQDRVEDALNISRKAKQIMNEAAMNLRKWMTNDLELMKRWEEEGFEIHPYKVDDSNETLKVLGMFWDTYQDSLSVDACSLIESLNNKENTKRFILKTAGKIFDPLGLLSPFTVRLKLLLQELWVRKLSWDDELPKDISEEWVKWCCECPDLCKITVPRFVLSPDADSVEIHCFSDASQKAYGAVVYARFIIQGSPSVNFIASKCRVAPVKRVTLPRLELLGALLAARLGCEVKRVFDQKKISTMFYWTDAKIVLCWIKGSSSKWKSFIANRVHEIRNLTEPKDWFYCSTKDNPADLLTRGVKADYLVNSSKWWSCSDFLTRFEIPEQDLAENLEECADELKGDFNDELRNCTQLTLVTYKELHFVNDIVKLSSNYAKLIRIVSFIFRFVNNCKGFNTRKEGVLSLNEVKTAENWLLIGMQRTEFREEIEQLKKGKCVSPKSRVASLNVFLDDLGLMRVGGRLSHSDLPENSKHPIVLPGKHPLTTIILEYFHLKYFHVGSQALLHQVRQKFWPLNGRNNCRKIVHRCVTCFKNKPVTTQQLMAELPRERITPAYPFNVTGVDFCGPFAIKYKNQRKGTVNKTYIAVYVCMSTKAIHLDFVTDLTSQSFIASLKRFFARRGKCARIMSDNSKTFSGANLELKKLQKLVTFPDENLANFYNTEGIEWKFIPPRSPNFGGIWESGVKSFKFHFKRVVGEQRLNLEEFLTILTEIEGVLNSRPLTPISADFDNFEVLTPGHFLVGRPLTTLIEPDLSEIKENRLTKWQKITKYTQKIWKLWKRDYLNNLQERHKWKFVKDDVQLGTLVLVKDENFPSTKWLVGRIAEIFHGRDNRVRVVTVRLPNQKFLKRNVRDVCILPVE